MSLISHLKDSASPARQFMYDRFPNIQAISRECKTKLSGATTLRPDTQGSNYPYNIIGTALDYRLRYYFAVTPPEKLVAWHGASRLGWGHGDIPLFDLRTGEILINADTGEELYGPDFFPSLEDTLRKILPVNRRLMRSDEEQLNRYCVVLALLEVIARSGDIARSPLVTPNLKTSTAELLERAENAWIDDLCQLSWGFYDQASDLLSKQVVLNPVFDGSPDVGGADADLIVDGCLIDIKTTIKPQIEPLWLYQLLGYALLDYSDRYRIRSVAIYLARQQVMLQWRLDDLIAILSNGTGPSLDQLRADFRNTVASRARRGVNQSTKGLRSRGSS